MEEYIKIPKERLPVLIGKNGSVKKKIEEYGNVKLKINSDTCDVEISDSENIIVCMSVIKAIGIGFSPENAFLVFEEDTCLHLINIKDYVGAK